MPTSYDCSKCPGYCCSYDRIEVKKSDVARLAKHFHITPEVAEERFTKIRDGERVLRQQKDKYYGSICAFFDTTLRRCTVYESRPAVCREYPDRPECGYFDFLQWEREFQEDEEFVPLQLG